MARQELQLILEALASAVTQSGESLAVLSAASPVLVVFLRHAGCTFCRETLSDIGHSRAAIENTGTRIVLIHMGGLESQFERHGLEGIDHISDPDRRLYEALGLKRGRPGQLFGPRVMWRAFAAGVLARHGAGRVSGDSFQMPGVFVLQNAAIVRRFRHRSAADRPDYAALCTFRYAAEP